MKSKLPDVGTTIFTIMSQMAQDEGAINLSQGFPDFAVPAELKSLLDHYVRSDANQYPPMAGVPGLRQAISDKIRQTYQTDVDWESEITITSGATEALFVATQAVISSGDDCIVLDPAYDAYDPAIRLAGGKAVHVPLMPGSFKPDWDAIAAALTPRTQAIFVNSPHNPCGSVFAEDDLDALAELAEKHGLYVISDEVYEHMVYDGRRHHSLLQQEGLSNRTFIVSSFGKTYHATGWKVGYCVAPAQLTEEFRKIHQFVTFTTHTPTQWALADYMQQYPDHARELPQFYQQKRDHFLAQLDGSAFTWQPSAGTYFQLLDYRSITDMDDVSFVNYLTREVKVAAIPISVFYETPVQTGFVRLCFAKDNDTLTEACERLSNISL